MKVEVRDLNPSLLVQSRGGEVSELRTALDEIEGDEELHNRLLTIAVYNVAAEPGKAHSHKMSLVNTYGNTPEVLGWQFSVARSTDGKEEYLAAQYLPERILEGAWETFSQIKKEKAKAAKERQAERELEKKLAAQG